jgi:hypothetical protein
MNGAQGWLAVAEPGRVCIASIQAGRWLALRSQRVSTSLRDSLPALLEQARLAAPGDMKAGPVYLVSREEPPFRLPAESGWSIEPVAWGH